MHKRVGILNNSATYIKSFFKENEDLIKALKDKLSASEKKPAQSSFTIKKLMTDSQKLNDIINNT